MRAWPVLLFLPLAGCLGGEGEPPGVDAPPDPAMGELGLQRVWSDLSRPLLVAHAPDGRIVVVEQCGKSFVASGPNASLQPYFDLTNKTSCNSERGFLGLAFAPDHNTSKRLYVAYTDSAGDSVLARYTEAAGKPGKPEILLTVDQPASNHNGGHLEFGRDGYLYYALGDGGLARDAFRNGQQKTTLLGTIMRLDVSPATGYKIPPDNPFVDDPTGRDEVWAWGLRNPWRFHFDATTGDMWVGDVGQDAWEELNHEPFGGPGGRNYGWPVYEGTHLHEPGVVLDHTPPVAEYANGPPEPECSITAGPVARDPLLPELEGAVLLGDFCSGKVWTLRKEAGKWEMHTLFETGFRISSFGTDGDERIYVVDYQGAVHRLAKI